MTTDQPRGKPPRASRLMVDLFQAIGACEDAIDYWDLGKRADGVQVRVRSRQRHPSEQAAVDAGQLLAKRLCPPDCEVLEQSVTAQTEGSGDSGWTAVVELGLA